GTTTSRFYTYGLQRISENQQISNAWTPSFYGYDGGGTVRLLTDSAGTVTDTYDYDAWGNTVNTTGSTPNVYLFRGERYDADLGLYYLRARYFDPLTGRFLTRDPGAGHVVVPATLHKYLYAGGNPVTAEDPTGRSVTDEYSFLNSTIDKPLFQVSTGATPLATGITMFIMKVWCYSITALNVGWYAATGGKQFGPPSLPADIKALCGLLSLAHPPGIPGAQ
ncbi:MAG: RHS repeat-associated core domain-containing protein, partial [Bryobacteraceae bacterium]